MLAAHATDINREPLSREQETSCHASPETRAIDRKLRTIGPAQRRSKPRVFPAVSPLFEAFGRTTENRGVPGSSAGLAIAAKPDSCWISLFPGVGRDPPIGPGMRLIWACPAETAVIPGNCWTCPGGPRVGPGPSRSPIVVSRVRVTHVTTRRSSVADRSRRTGRPRRARCRTASTSRRRARFGRRCCSSSIAITWTTAATCLLCS
jgi:hypothetical protein